MLDTEVSENCGFYRCEGSESDDGGGSLKLVETEKVKDLRSHRLHIMAMREKETYDFGVNPQ